MISFFRLTNLGDFSKNKNYFITSPHTGYQIVMNAFVLFIRSLDYGELNRNQIPIYITYLWEIKKKSAHLCELEWRSHRLK